MPQATNIPHQNSLVITGEGEKLELFVDMTVSQLTQFVGSSLELNFFLFLCLSLLLSH